MIACVFLCRIQISRFANTAFQTPGRKRAIGGIGGYSRGKNVQQWWPKIQYGIFLLSVCSTLELGWVGLRRGWVVG